MTHRVGVGRDIYHLSIYLPIYLYRSISVCIYIYICIWISIYKYIIIQLYTHIRTHRVGVRRYLSPIFQSLYLSLSMYTSLSRSVYIYIYIYISLSIYNDIHTLWLTALAWGVISITYLSIFLPISIYLYLYASISISVSIYLSKIIKLYDYIHILRQRVGVGRFLSIL